MSVIVFMKVWCDPHTRFPSDGHRRAPFLAIFDPLLIVCSVSQVRPRELRLRVSSSPAVFQIEVGPMAIEVWKTKAFCARRQIGNST